MYNLFKWLNCSVVKETVMCQKDIVLLHGLMKIVKAICPNKCHLHYLLGFAFLFKKATEMYKMV